MNMKNVNKRLFNGERRKISILPSECSFTNAAVILTGLLDNRKIKLVVTAQNLTHEKPYVSLPKLMGTSRITAVALDETSPNCYFISMNGGEKEPCDIVVG